MQSSTKNKKTHHQHQNNKINPSTTKFLFCFKPVVMEDEILRPDAPRKTRSLGRNTANRVDTIFKYVHHDDGGLAFSKQFQPYTSNNSKESTDCKKKKIHKKFARLLKAVWFETSLARKIKRRKSTNQEPQEPNGSVILEEVGKESNTTQKKSSDNLPPKGSFPPTSAVKLAKNSNLTLRHSHSTSSVSSCLRTMAAMRNPPLIQPNSFAVKQQQQQQKQQKQENHLQEEYGKGCHSTNYGLCLILISLLVLVLWGKACAIICTSTWLFLVPLFLQSDQKRSSNRNGIHGQEKDTLEYKKKIIMEGLMERTSHNPSVSKET